MSVYRCMSCEKHTDDLDVMPCGKESCDKFKPLNVATVHFAKKVNDAVTIGCNVDKRNAMHMTNSVPAVTCPKCLNGIKEDWQAANLSLPGVTGKSTSPLPEDATIGDLGLPEHILAALQADKRFHFAIDLIGFINSKNEFDVANLTNDDLIIIKAALYLQE